MSDTITLVQLLGGLSYATTLFLMAAGLTAWLPGGLWSCFAVLGSVGAAIGLLELLRQRRTRLG